MAWLPSLPKHIYASLGSRSLMSSNVRPVYNLLWDLDFLNLFAQVSNPKFILTSLLVVSQFLFRAPNRPPFFLAVSSHPYTISRLFSVSSVYWISTSVLCSSFVNGICAIQNSTGERKDPWYILLRI